jgi:hypothetical protein
MDHETDQLLRRARVIRAAAEKEYERGRAIVRESRELLEDAERKFGPAPKRRRRVDWDRV